MAQQTEETGSDTAVSPTKSLSNASQSSSIQLHLSCSSATSNIASPASSRAVSPISSVTPPFKFAKLSPSSNLDSSSISPFRSPSSSSPFYVKGEQSFKDVTFTDAVPAVGHGNTTMDTPTRQFVEGSDDDSLDDGANMNDDDNTNTNNAVIQTQSPPPLKTPSAPKLSSKIKRRKNKRKRGELSPENVSSTPTMTKRTATTMGRVAAKRRPDTPRPTPPTSNEPSPEIKQEKPWKDKYLFADERLASRWGKLEKEYLDDAKERAQGRIEKKSKRSMMTLLFIEEYEENVSEGREKEKDDEKNEENENENDQQ